MGRVSFRSVQGSLVLDSLPRTSHSPTHAFLVTERAGFVGSYVSSLSLYLGTTKIRKWYPLRAFCQGTSDSRPYPSVHRSFSLARHKQPKKKNLPLPLYTLDWHIVCLLFLLFSFSLRGFFFSLPLGVSL